MADHGILAASDRPQLGAPFLGTIPRLGVAVRGMLLDKKAPRRGSHRWSAVVVALLVWAATLTGTPALADEPTGVMSGTVTDATGAPVADVSVGVGGGSDSDGWFNAQAVTRADGTWRVDGLGDGRYRASFTPPAASGLAKQRIPQQTVSNARFGIEVRDGRTATPVDVTLQRAGSISGTVTDTAGTPISVVAGLYVRVEGEWEWTDAVRTIGGTYSFEGLHPYEYAIRFSSPNWTDYLTEWWGGSRDEAGAASIQVNAGGAHTGIDAQLTAGAVLGGVMRPPAGQRLQWPGVSVYERVDGEWTFVDQATVRSDGSYRLRGLPAGEYTLFADAYMPDHGTIWWGGGDDASSAQPIILGDGETRLDLDFDFKPLVPSTTPVLTGTPRVGEALEVEATGWPAGTDLTYQWKRDAEVILGATGARHRLTADDVYDWINVVLVARHPDYTTVTYSFTTDTSVRPGTFVSTKPTLRGEPWIGSTLTVDLGEWSPGADITYTWYADDHVLKEHGPTLYVSESLYGRRIAVAVEGSARGYDASARYWSDRTDVVSAPPVTTATPTIAGTVTVGQTLQAVPGDWTPGTAFTYQWHLDGRDVAGATSASWKLPASAMGKSVSVTVTGSLSGYITAAKTSSRTPAVTGLTLVAATPKIAGLAKPGATLTASRGTWTSGTAFRYQWYLDGRAISGATRSSWKVSTSAAGKQVAVKVSGSKAGYTSVSRTSARTLHVPRVGVVKLVGTAKVGRTLTVSRGTWTGATSFTYQWFANGKAISKATRSTYKVPSSMRGKQLSVTVTGRKAGYTTVAVASPRTRAVAR